MGAKVFEIPRSSYFVIAICLAIQARIIYLTFYHPGFSILITAMALILATYVADLITSIFHFGFDYVWPDEFPVMGPLSVEFREHHEAPELDPSELKTNFTKGSYMGILFGVFAWLVGELSYAGGVHYFLLSTLTGISIWGIFFHQVHSYSHMGKAISPEEFNAVVERISKLPASERKKSFAILFERAGIPRHIRFLQRIGLILRPEVHWQHHHSFESHFSSLNGLSDPLTNIFFGPLARAKKKRRVEALMRPDKSNENPAL